MSTEVLVPHLVNVCVNVRLVRGSLASALVGPAAATNIATAFTSTTSLVTSTSGVHLGDALGVPTWATEDEVVNMGRRRV